MPSKPGKQLNIRCSDAFFRVTELVRETEGLSIPETLREMFLDRAVLQVSFAVKSKSITLADFGAMLKKHADGEWAGLYAGLIAALTKIGADPGFKHRYRAWRTAPEQSEDAALENDVKSVIRKETRVAVPA